MTPDEMPSESAMPTETPVAASPAPISQMAATATAILETPEIVHGGVRFNLFTNREGMEDEPLIVGAAAATASVPTNVRAGHRRGIAIGLGALLLALLAGGAGVYAVHSSRQATASPTAVAVLPKATPIATSSPTPSPSPPPSVTPTPVTVVPQTVSAPAIAPTADHPQPVVVTSKSGLWLRSSATSVNSKNIISWIPNGASVSVDATGEFWWHGSYGGKTGYFASTFTQ